MRGLKDVSFSYLDEADFFPPGQSKTLVMFQRYIAKSNPWIVMVSTPNTPEGFFERIEKEPESTCLYKRLFLDYTYGLGKIYTEQEIAENRVHRPLNVNITSSMPDWQCLSYQGY